MSGNWALPIMVGSPDRIAGRAEVLFVCTGNQCRSPFAQAIATRFAADRPVRFHSAGLVPGGASMPETGQRVAESAGYSFRDHRSREADLDDLAGFDLILTAAREQAREVLAHDPDVWPRVFTIKQFARWAQEHPRPRRSMVSSWVDAVAADRPRESMLGQDPADDLADPIGAAAPAWIEMVEQLNADLSTIVEWLDPPRR